MNITPKAIYDWYHNTIRNPKYRGWIILGTLVYLISPIDIAPDFIPIAGQLDDVMIVSLLVAEVSQLVIERFKLKKGNVASTTEEAKNETIEVDAVSVD